MIIIFLTDELRHSIVPASLLQRPPIEEENDPED
jgi:hypothetical protein